MGYNDDRPSLGQLVSHGSASLFGRSSMTSVGLQALRMSLGRSRLLLGEG